MRLSCVLFLALVVFAVIASSKSSSKLDAIQRATNPGDCKQNVAFAASIGGGFGQQQCKDFSNLRKNGVLRAAEVCRGNGVEILSSWEKMWEPSTYTPNPAWQWQGTTAYTHPAVNAADEGAIKAYCQKLGRKPVSRSSDYPVSPPIPNDPKNEPFFYADNISPGLLTKNAFGMANAPLNTPDWENLPNCLGFAEDIDDYIIANRGKPEKACRRLSSWFWTPEFNMRYVACIAKGYLGTGGYLWTSAADKANKAKDNSDAVRVGRDRVTAGEACLAHSLGVTWPVSTVPCSLCQSTRPNFCECKEAKSKLVHTAMKAANAIPTPKKK